MAKIFISYSHQDEQWKDLLQSHLGVLEKQGKLSIWDDRQIKTGDDWLAEIEKSLATADIAILLISRHFLTSDFILNKEVPQLMQRWEKQGLRIIPVIISPCAWQGVDWLSAIQGYPKDNVALSSKNEHEIDEALASLGNRLSQPEQHQDPEAQQAFLSSQQTVSPSDIIHRSQRQMSKHNPTIKAAWIGAIAILLAAIITGAFTLFQSTTDKPSHTTETEPVNKNITIEASGNSQAFIATDNARVNTQQIPETQQKTATDKE